MNSDDLLNLLQGGANKSEKSMGDFLQMINRRKKIIIIAVIAAILGVLAFNFMSKPYYSATVLLKKENSEKSSRDEVNRILAINTQDQIETEMELVATRGVVEKVVTELNLNLVINRIERPEGDPIEVNKNILDYNDIYSSSNNSEIKLPEFLEVETKPSNYTYNYLIRKASQNTFEVYDENSAKLIQKINDPSTADINFEKARILLYWPDAQVNSKLYLDFLGTNDVVNLLKDKITTDHKQTTDIFSITTTAKTPTAAVTLANTIADKFRETRIDQQKESIRYSYNFIDQQLQKIDEKLKESEGNLSTYKSGNQIVKIDENSTNLVDFLSKLEAEKINTGLMLSDYENKLASMKKQFNDQGYFDQTTISTEGSNSSSSTSPFADLMNKLSSLEVKRIELLQKRTDTHPEVMNLDNQIAELKNKLSSYNQNTFSAYQININALKHKDDNLNKLISRYEGKIKTLPGQETKLAELTRAKETYEQVFNMLMSKREEMRMSELSKLQDIIIAEPAYEATNMQRKINPIFGLLFGLVLGVGIILGLESMNKKITDADDIEADFGLPIFAIIPNYDKAVNQNIKNAANYKDRFVTLMENQDGFRESYRVLRTKLASTFNAKKKIIMFTSCEENTGKTTVVANLAISLAQAEKKVLIIDCDLRKSRLTEEFEISKDSPGLINYLTQDINIPNIYNLNKNFLPEGTQTGNNNSLKTLNILPSGGINENSSDLLGSEKMDKLIEMINDSSYDYILLDTPPITRVVDVLVLGRRINDVVMIVRPDHTIKESVNWAIKELGRVEVKVDGIVVNACDIKNSYFKHTYGYGYGYYYGYNENGEKGVKKKKRYSKTYS